MPPPHRIPTSKSASDGDSSKRPVRVAVTGFGPFAKVPVNPSWQCLLPLRDSDEEYVTERTSIPMHIDFFEIPVIYHEVLARIQTLHNLSASGSAIAAPSEPYDLFVHFGVAPSRSHYYFESGARRYGYEKEDFDKQFAKSRVDPSSGKRLSGFITQEWDQDAEGRLNCAVDVTELANRLKRSGKAEVKLSDDAGLFLCEFTYYASMACAKRNAQGAAAKPVLFVHIPQEDKPYSMQHMTQTALAIISELADDIAAGR